MLRRNMKENIILVDCDGVLCNWEYAFTHFMEHTKQIKTQNYNEYNVGKRFGVTKEQGSKYVEEFNDSAAIAFLPPLRDAVYYMKRLNMLHGYKFICVTSLSTFLVSLTVLRTSFKLSRKSMKMRRRFGGTG